MNASRRTPAAAAVAAAVLSRRSDSLNADEFDILVRDLIPRVRVLLPDLSDVEVLRAAARIAEYRLSDERTLFALHFRERY